MIIYIIFIYYVMYLYIIYIDTIFSSQNSIQVFLIKKKICLFYIILNISKNCLFFEYISIYILRLYDHIL